MRSLITGVTGQDGAYLSALLREQGHEVYGLVAPGDTGELPAGVHALPGDIRDGDGLARAIEAADPDWLFNLAAISSVSRSWDDPELVAEVNGVGVVRLLNLLRQRIQDGHRPTRFVQASSAEIFGDAAPPQNESTPIRPVTPYGAAKALAHHAVSVFRTAGVPACAAVLYNHESPLRPAGFVTRKITSTVARIATGSREQLEIADLTVRRDWGHAADYVRALAMIAAYPEPGDFVIASGVSRSVEEFVVAAFAHVGIDDWRPHVRVDSGLRRSADAREQRGDAAKARDVLGWRPQISFEALVAEMVDADLADLPFSLSDR
ncbi:MAG TPA: GDP-mannose 4,6-dehydratase [Jatrophihabitantaceae bacterium]|nr:GDP-mannose 4,6-dehydratase [Jatrophihabitantaceae bacterium]